jgi:predicted secreted hydrolase
MRPPPTTPTSRRRPRRALNAHAHAHALAWLAAALLGAGCAATTGLVRPEAIAPFDDAPSACREVPPGKVALPADDGAHPQPVEWWYWTGHLKADDGRWFGFEEVFFRGKFKGIPSKMAHLAVTDVSAGAFHHGAVTGLGDLVAPAGGFDLALGGLGAIGGGGHDHLHGKVDGYELDLDLRALKAPVLQHGTGYTDYPFGGNTYYYSRERMAAAGTLLVDGARRKVSGTAWFDHQYGDLFKTAQIGWDWYAIQLDDHREIMLFVVRDPAGPVLVGGSLSGPGCEQTELRGYQITPLGTWVSPHTGCSYPMGWRVEVAGTTLELTPVLQDQELFTTHPIYWEGAATVSGGATGRAYVELTGYCKKPSQATSAR